MVHYLKIQSKTNPLEVAYVTIQGSAAVVADAMKGSEDKYSTILKVMDDSSLTRWNHEAKKADSDLTARLHISVADVEREFGVKKQ